MRILGRVISGDGVGRTLGWPTANLAVEGELAGVENGVYAARVEIDGRHYGAMANLGVKPTFGGGRRVLEFHIFGFSDNIYGCEVTVELRDFVRPEQKFESADELRAQISRDSQTIKEILTCI